MMKAPAYLKKGDRVGIVACARKVSVDELQPAINILTGWGLEVVLGKHIFNIDNQFSGTDKERAHDLQAMFDDTTIKAVLSARGGYGTMRIVDDIDYTKVRQQPKWFIGYSDVTVLHTHLHNLKLQTIHGTMPINFLKDEESVELLRRALFGEGLDYIFDGFRLNRKGDATGEVVGGNLSLLYASIGSISDIDTNNKILFIEDLDEYLYHVDRMMISLRRAGKLNKLKGLMVGGMSDMKDNTTAFGKTVEEIIMDAVKGYDYPVCFNFPAGHIQKNFPLYFGRNANLQVSTLTCKLTFT